MKTPRDLLLRHHRLAMPRLDAVRRQVLREYVVGPADAQDQPRPLAGFLASLWRELFWSCRHAWAGLALVWLVVLPLNLAEPAPRTSSAVSSAARPSRERRMAMAEQARLRAELLNGETAPLTEADPLRPPGPRSERPASSEPREPHAPQSV